MSISRNKHFLEYEIAEREIAMKDVEDKSWFNLIKQILGNCSLPSIFYLFDQQLSKEELKKSSPRLFTVILKTCGGLK